MISKFEGIYTLTCDICGDEYPETFFDFYDAVKTKRENGWKSRKSNGGWLDVCDACLEEESNE